MIIKLIADVAFVLAGLGLAVWSNEMYIKCMRAVNGQGLGPQSELAQSARRANFMVYFGVVFAVITYLITWQAVLDMEWRGPGRYAVFGAFVLPALASAGVIEWRRRTLRLPKT